MCDGVLKKEAFEDYQAIGRLHIKSVSLLQKYLESFDDVITIEKLEEYLLKLYDDKREVYIVLGSDLVVDNILDDIPENVKEMTFNTKISLKYNDFKKISKDVALLGVTKVDISAKDKEFTVLVGEKGESDYLVNKIALEEDVTEATVTLGEYFLQTMAVMCDEFVAEFDTDRPVRITETMELMDFTCIIAPMNDQ
jgi:hypothetical protein